MATRRADTGSTTVSSTVEWPRRVGIVASGVLVAVAVFYLFVFAPAHIVALSHSGSGTLSAYERSEVEAAARQAILLFLGGSIAAAGVIYTHRRYVISRREIQHLVETEATRREEAAAADKRLDAREKARREEAAADRLRLDERELSARFVSTAGQLASAAASARVAGLYAMAALADAWAAIGRADQRQVCISVICGYLCQPYESDPRGAEHGVRRTGIRIIADHLGKDVRPESDWRSCVFDLADATFDSGNFTGIDVQGSLILTRARFVAGEVSFRDATFTNGSINLTGASFEGATVDFSKAMFRSTSDGDPSGGPWDKPFFFEGARLSAGELLLNLVEFVDCDVIFDDLQVTGGKLQMVGTSLTRDAFNSGPTMRFVGANFSGGSFQFVECAIRDATVSFEYGAKWSGGEAYFMSVKFEEAGELRIKADVFESGRLVLGNIIGKPGVSIDPDALNADVAVETRNPWDDLP